MLVFAEHLFSFLPRKIIMTSLLSYITWAPDEIAFHIGSFGIRWYSLCWLVGLLLGYLLMHRLYRQQKLTEEQFEPLFIYIFVGVLIGARLGHCLFYEPGYFLSSGKHFVEMLLPIRFMYDGSVKFTGYQGLASHGGVAGMLIAIWLYCRRSGVRGWVVLDNMGICSCVTAAFIRLGNLMNSEIVGKVTDVPWAFLFVNGSPDIAGAPRHPGQLYESLSYIVIFFIILAVYRHKGPKSVGGGLYFGLCLTLVFTARFLLEYTKEVQEAFESSMPIDMGQLLSLPFIAVGIWSIVHYRRQHSAQQ